MFGSYALHPEDERPPRLPTTYRVFLGPWDFAVPGRINRKAGKRWTRCRQVSPRSNVSMMRMHSQHGHREVSVPAATSIECDCPHLPSKRERAHDNASRSVQLRKTADRV